MSKATISWTHTDEAPALASYSLLPVVKAFTKGADIEVEVRDISLSGRIIANFPEDLTDEQRIPDELSALGAMAKTPEATIVKLPNISASVGQLLEAIKELQDQGYKIPDYPENPKTDEEKDIQARYAKVLGSAVNPVLREGNSDRRAAASVKKFAQKNPHRMMKAWPEAGSKTRVAHMTEKDFFGSEKSASMEKPEEISIVFVGKDGSKKTLKEKIMLQQDEVVDCSAMNVKALRAYFTKEMEQTKKEDALLSLHMKATMMKVSDPIIFGHCVAVYYEEALAKHADTLREAGIGMNKGLSGVLSGLEKLPADKKTEIEKDIEAVYANRPSLAMVDSRKGITNLHNTNDIIIDASMPNVVRDGGKMWNKDDQLQDTVALIPDRSYATMYQAVIEDCQKNGQFDPATMGGVSNVGLMAQKAEEYGSHDKTFEAPGDGHIQLVNLTGDVLLEQDVEEGDIFRACQTKDAPIKDWIKLAVSRAKASGSPAVFWLDKERAHDAQLIKKIEKYLPEFDTEGLEIKILKPVDAMNYTLERVRKGEDTISVTGNVLRDYLTDLFPILELGTSARMLSIVPLMNGGGLFETGAGGSAPKHVQQFLEENHLRWDSLGEYCALVPTLEHIAEKSGNQKAQVLADALDAGISKYLENEKSPSRKVNELDNRGSTFYLTLYWAQALAEQSKDSDIQNTFKKVAEELTANELKIVDELNSAQGGVVDIKGYYRPDAATTEKFMRPRATLNQVIDGL